MIYGSNSFLIRFHPYKKACDLDVTKKANTAKKDFNGCPDTEWKRYSKLVLRRSKNNFQNLGES